MRLCGGMYAINLETLPGTVLILLLCPKNAKGKHKHTLKGRLNWAQPTEAECHWASRSRSPSTTPSGECGWSAVCAFTTCHIWAGLTSLECESFLTLSLFLNGICAEGEKDLFFTVYLQISCPVSLCLQKSKFNIPIKRKTRWNSSFTIQNDWLTPSVSLGRSDPR